MLTASTPTSSSDAYLWQRDGSASAIATFAGWSSGRLHVLASDDSPKFVRGDDAVMKALRASQVPVIASVRLQSLHDDAVFAAVAAFKGANVKAVEVDFDCGVVRLASYATWLQATQRQLGDVPLTITALPAWLDHVDHVAVFDAAAEVVLQVHSVRAPALLDVDAAIAAVTKAQKEAPSSSKLRIALPTYATSLKDGTQLHASVADVARVRAVADRVAWFRFPSPGDDAAWDLVTLRAVDERGGSGAGLAVRLTPNDDGSRDVHVVNSGDVALALPCVGVFGAVAHDAHAGFVVDDCAVCPAVAQFVFGHSDVVVGWARPSAAGALDVAPLSATAAVARRRACRR